MNKEQLTRDIANYISNKLFGGNVPADFNNNTALISSRLLNSIVVLGMVNDFEEKYKIELEAHEVNVENLDSINKIADFIFLKLSK